MSIVPLCAVFFRCRKAVSRVMCRHEDGVCHLSTHRSCLRAGAAYPPAMDEQSLTAGIFGLATRRMCGLPCHHGSRWALTPPSHPYHLQGRGGCFLSLISGVAAGFPLGNMMLCVARTFLLKETSQATDRFSAFYILSVISPFS